MRAPYARISRSIFRARLSWAARWGGVVVCVLIASVWIATFWRSVSLVRSAAPGGAFPWEGITAEGGCLMYRSTGRIRPVVNPVYWTQINPAQPHEWWWWTAWVWWPGTKFVAVPLAIPFVLVASTTAALMLAERRRAKALSASLCTNCGYPLTGLAPTAVCPECGTARA